MSERILNFEEALDEVIRHASSLLAPAPSERVDLLAARGRVLRAPIIAERDQPPFPRSTRDGFAVRSADIASTLTALHLVGSVRAGERWTGPSLARNQALEIMTGAPVPDGADAVIMVEHVELHGNVLKPEAGRHPQPGENIVAAGAEARAGAELVPAGRRIGTPEISVAASCGYPQLEVNGTPGVAIVATGDELVEVVGAEPQPWQIRNSNSYSLAALVGAEGARAHRLPIARDLLPDLRARLAEASTADLLVLSGGVSMGKYDLVEEALREAGAEFLFTGVRIQPGRPLVFGRLPSPARVHQPWTYFFGLPGNPVSTEVCFRLFVAPMLRALCGCAERAPHFSEARLSEDVRGGAQVTRFLPAFVDGKWQRVSVRPVPWQGSGDLAANARANGFVVLPSGVEHFPAGETVRVLLR